MSTRPQREEKLAQAISALHAAYCHIETLRAMHSGVYDPIAKHNAEVGRMIDMHARLINDTIYRLRNDCALGEQWRLSVKENEPCATS